jgi:hypothetical protein
MQIKISHVFTPSENQVNKGILGTANLALTDDDGAPIVYLSGITVRRTKDGKTRFLSMPSYSINKNGETVYRSHFSLFPLGKTDETKAAQRARMDKLCGDVLRVLDAGGTQRNTGAPPAQAAPIQDTEGIKTTPWGAV